MREGTPQEMRSWPLVSIVTPSYEQAAFIEATLSSVCEQSYSNIEHIVVDGASKDGTQDILRKFEGRYNLRWISEPDSGQSAAVNKGVAMAHGEIIGWLNSDDIYLFQDTIERVVEAFLRYKPDVLMGDMAFLDRYGKVIQFYGYRRPDRRSLMKGVFNLGQPSVFIRRSVFLVNPVREHLHYAMDLDLWLRLFGTYKTRSVREVFAGARMYPGTKSSSPAYMSEEQSVRMAYGCSKVASRLERRAANVFALKVRGLMQLIACRYVLRRKLAGGAFYSPPPVDFASQIFRKMRRDYSVYWPPYVSFVRVCLMRLVTW